MAIYFIATATSFVMSVCVVLVFHKDFHTGVIGNIAFALICLAALGRLDGILEKGQTTPSSLVSCMLWAGLALYFGQLAVRFYVRLRRRGTVGWYENGSEKI